MNDKERYSREAKAKGGSVPPDERRNSKARSASSKEHMPNQGSSFDKTIEAKRECEASGEITTLDIERVSEDQLKEIAWRDLNP
ncbi:MAG TPA: hypothetical protein V6D47_08265 [Oscillatoriaceae cyanobacterium]